MLRGALMQDRDEYPLTPYDEYPVHQAPYPISYVPATDYAWDEGYFYGVYSADAQVLLLTGMRINQRRRDARARRRQRPGTSADGACRARGASTATRSSVTCATTCSTRIATFD